MEAADKKYKFNELALKRDNFKTPKTHCYGKHTPKSQEYVRFEFPKKKSISLLTS